MERDKTLDEWEDPIVAEVRAVRAAHAKKFNYDLKAIFEDLKASQKKWEERGFEFISLPPKRIQKLTGTNG